MMRGFIVIITAILALVFLGRKQYLHHWLSMASIILGIAIVGVVNIKGTSAEDAN